MLKVTVLTIDDVEHNIADVRYVTYADKYIIIQHDICNESKTVFPERYVKYMTTDPQ